GVFISLLRSREYYYSVVGKSIRDACSHTPGEDRQAVRAVRTVRTRPRAMARPSSSVIVSSTAVVTNRRLHGVAIWLMWSGLSMRKWLTTPKTSEAAMVSATTTPPYSLVRNDMPRPISGPAKMTTNTKRFAGGDIGTLAPAWAAP